MNPICVYTCITGNYDNLPEIKTVEPDIDYICFTNNLNITSKTWRIIHIEDVDNIGNIQLSRKIKILGMPILKQYGITVYTDGHIQFNCLIKDFINEFVDLKRYDLVGFRHHCRNSVYDEMNSCYELGKESKENMLRLSRFFEEENFTDGLGLMEATVLFRNFNNTCLTTCMELWFKTFISFSNRDQLTFPYAWWKTKINVNLLDINVFKNEYFSALGHSNNHKISAEIISGHNSIYDFRTIKTFEFENLNEIEIEIPGSKSYNSYKIIFNTNSEMLINKHNIATDRYRLSFYNSVIDQDGKILFGDKPVIELHDISDLSLPFTARFCVSLSKTKEIYTDSINRSNQIIKKEHELLVSPVKYLGKLIRIVLRLDKAWW